MVMTQGWEIRDAREAVGMKAKDLARAIGITPEHLSRVENGHKPVHTMLSIAVASVLKNGD